MTFTGQFDSIHKTAEEGGKYLFNSSLPRPHFIDISWAITAKSLPLHISSSRNQTGNLIYIYNEYYLHCLEKKKMLL